MKTSSETIYQCQRCLRQHDGRGGLLALRFCVPSLVACGRGDCEEAVAEQSRRAKARKEELVNRRERKERTDCKAGGNMSSPESRSTRCVAERPVRLPYADDESGFGNEPVQSPRSKVQGPVVARALSQSDFVASGKANSANEKLLEFFEHTIRSGQVGNWFSRKFLKEVCGNDYINNRVDDVRGVLAPRGFKIVNAEVAPHEGVAKSSHYRLQLMTDEEWAEYERTQKPPTEI